MKRSRRNVIGGAVAAAAASSLPPQVFAKSKRKAPNIVFIMADDLGYADLSCYGRREYKTPNIDRLARQGVQMMQAYANSPVCSATRLALITGRYQYRLRAGLEEPLLPNTAYGLPADHATLPSMLRDAGYHTSLVGKWHLGNLPEYGPLKSGYDEFWGIRGGGVDYFSHTIAGQKDLWDGAQPVEKTGYLTELLGGKAVDVIEARRGEDRPFFLSLHFTAPHWPWQGPTDIEESLRLGKNNKLQSIVHFDGGSMDAYAAMVVSMDEQVGRVMKALDDIGAADNTIVVFTSDNGGERFSDVWPFTGKKGHLLEGGLRVPAIVRWPRELGRRVVSQQVAMSMDWMPTFLEAAGVEQPDLDGVSILASLKSGDDAFERTVCWRFLNFDQAACRIGKWKYLKILENEFLFDLDADPLERGNLKSRHPKVFERLSAHFDQWNSTMLPLDPNASTRGFTGADLADHVGVDKPVTHHLVETWKGD